MFQRFKSWFASSSDDGEAIAMQPPGERFPWPRGARLTAMELVTLAIPSATLARDDAIRSVILGDADMEICLPPNDAVPVILLRLREGQSAWLSKSVEAVVWAEDKRPRRIKVRPPPTPNA
jgi:hypothetical protein